MSTSIRLCLSPQCGFFVELHQRQPVAPVRFLLQRSSTTCSAQEQFVDLAMNEVSELGGGENGSRTGVSSFETCSRRLERGAWVLKIALR